MVYVANVYERSMAVGNFSVGMSVRAAAVSPSTVTPTADSQNNANNQSGTTSHQPKHRQVGL